MQCVWFYYIKSQWIINSEWVMMNNKCRESIAKNEFDRLNKKIESKITENRNFVNNYINILCGKILHLDGDMQIWLNLYLQKLFLLLLLYL